MSKVEIKRKFDEIVAFAEVEKCLDTPVKRYSSGTYVRLAFAVAAHLEPEILVVDEVLAVGDAQFQKKCLGKMEEVGKEGRTPISPLEILQSMHHARLNICMRFHSALFAETLGVPYIAIDYTGGGKIKAFLEGEDKLNQMVSLTEIVNGIWRNRWNALIEFSCLEPNRLPD